MNSLKDYLQNNINRLNNKLTSYLDIESSDLVREELESYEEQLKELNDLIEENDTLNKGIDELIEKYNERYNRKGFYLDLENTMICEFIKELKKLKGE